LLSSSWGRQPLLIRNAFAKEAQQLQKDKDKSTTVPWPTWQEIVDLACDGEASSEDWDWDNPSEEQMDHVIMEEDHDEFDDQDGPFWNAGESARLIQHDGPDQLDTFTLEMGPLDEARFVALNDSPSSKPWTLVVNDVDRYIPKVGTWMDETFAFLPRWRRDDAQVSLAPVGGGIGPHVDNYDVFLVQTSGARTWSIGTRTLPVQQEFDALLPDLPVRILNFTSP